MSKRNKKKKAKNKAKYNKMINNNKGKTNVEVVKPVDNKIKENNLKKVSENPIIGLVKGKQCLHCGSTKVVKGNDSKIDGKGFVFDGDNIAKDPNKKISFSCSDCHSHNIGNIGDELEVVKSEVTTKNDNPEVVVRCKRIRDGGAPCGSTKIEYNKKRNMYQCKTCGKSYSKSKYNKMLNEAQIRASQKISKVVKTKVQEPKKVIPPVKTKVQEPKKVITKVADQKTIIEKPADGYVYILNKEERELYVNYDKDTIDIAILTSDKKRYDGILGIINKGLKSVKENIIKNRKNGIIFRISSKGKDMGIVTNYLFETLKFKSTNNSLTDLSKLIVVKQPVEESKEKVVKSTNKDAKNITKKMRGFFKILSGKEQTKYTNIKMQDDKVIESADPKDLRAVLIITKNILPITKAKDNDANFKFLETALGIRKAFGTNDLVYWIKPEFISSLDNLGYQGIKNKLDIKAIIKDINVFKNFVGSTDNEKVLNIVKSDNNKLVKEVKSEAKKVKTVKNPTSVIGHFALLSRREAKRFKEIMNFKTKKTESIAIKKYNAVKITGTDGKTLSDISKIADLGGIQSTINKTVFWFKKGVKASKELEQLGFTKTSNKKIITTKPVKVEPIKNKQTVNTVKIPYAVMSKGVINEIIGPIIPIEIFNNLPMVVNTDHKSKILGMKLPKFSKTIKKFFGKRRSKKEIRPVYNAFSKSGIDIPSEEIVKAYVNTYKEADYLCRFNYSNKDILNNDLRYFIHYVLNTVTENKKFKETDLYKDSIKVIKRMKYQRKFIKKFSCGIRESNKRFKVKPIFSSIYNAISNAGITPVMDFKNRVKIKQNKNSILRDILISITGEKINLLVRPTGKVKNNPAAKASLQLDATKIVQNLLFSKPNLNVTFDLGV